MKAIGYADPVKGSYNPQRGRKSHGLRTTALQRHQETHDFLHNGRHFVLKAAKPLDARRAANFLSRNLIRF